MDFTIFLIILVSLFDMSISQDDINLCLNNNVQMDKRITAGNHIFFDININSSETYQCHCRVYPVLPEGYFISKIDIELPDNINPFETQCSIQPCRYVYYHYCSDTRPCVYGTPVHGSTTRMQQVLSARQSWSNLWAESVHLKWSGISSEQNYIARARIKVTYQTETIVVVKCGDFEDFVNIPPDVEPQPPINPPDANTIAPRGTRLPAIPNTNSPSAPGTNPASTSTINLPSAPRPALTSVYSSIFASTPSPTVDVTSKSSHLPQTLQSADAHTTSNINGTVFGGAMSTEATVLLQSTASSTTARAARSKQQHSLQMPLIVGISVGIVVIVVAVLIAIFLINYGKRRKPYDDEQINQRTDDIFPSPIDTYDAEPSLAPGDADVLKTNQTPVYAVVNKKSHEPQSGLTSSISRISYDNTSPSLYGSTIYPDSDSYVARLDFDSEKDGSLTYDNTIMHENYLYESGSVEQKNSNIATLNRLYNT